MKSWLTIQKQYFEFSKMVQLIKKPESSISQKHKNTELVNLDYFMKENNF
jgi:hypothetical protein